jgi:hypothetical protein
MKKSEKSKGKGCYSLSKRVCELLIFKYNLQAKINISTSIFPIIGGLNIEKGN